MLQPGDSTIPFALEGEFSIAVVNSVIAVARSCASSGSPATPKASRFLPIKGILSDASSTTRADITLIVSVRDAWARVALGDALSSATGCRRALHYRRSSQAHS